MSEDKKNNLPENDKKNDSGAASYSFEDDRKPSSYSAYTSPAEQDQSSFSPQSPSVPPVFPPPNISGKRRRKGKIRSTVIIVAAALIILASLCTYLFTRYDFQFSSTDGVIKFSFIPHKVAPGPQQSGAEASPNVSHRPGPGQGQGQVPPSMTTLPVPSSSSWDGHTVLNLVSPSSAVELSYKEIYKKCSPSIVSVKVTTSSGSGSASGVVMSSNGYIITNQHVVDSATAITVTLSNGRQYSALVVGSDEHTDLAVLRIDADNLIPAEFCDSQSVEVGDTVVAIGNPINQNLTMTNGIISAINRNIGYKGYSMTLLQTDAAINEGNSGGALINMYGQIIGITNMKMVSYYSSIEGIGFAIPTSVISPVIDDILKDGYVAGRPALGIIYSDIPVSAIIFYRLPGGVYINDVDTKSDAGSKDLRKGDIICAANGTTIASSDDLDEIVNKYSAGDKITLSIYRNGTIFDLEIVLMDKHDIK